MRKGRIKDLDSGDVIEVTAVLNKHEKCSVWVDATGKSYMPCDSSADEKYKVVYDSYSERARVGKMIAEQRNGKGYSTRQLAELSGVNFANIGKIERGMYNVSVDILRNICDALDVEIALIPKSKGSL